METPIKGKFIKLSEGFTYDVERAAAAVEKSPLPDKYAEMLRRGY